MILTGIGDVRTSKRTNERSQSDPWYLETAEAEDPNVLGLAVGNIGGVWIARDDLPVHDRSKVEQVNERWLGAQHADFRRCSLNAVTGQRPGVVVLAVEPEKAGVILEALYLINVLVISRELAEALAGQAARRTQVARSKVRGPGHETQDGPARHRAPHVRPCHTDDKQLASCPVPGT